LNKRICGAPEERVMLAPGACEPVDDYFIADEQTGSAEGGIADIGQDD